MLCLGCVAVRMNILHSEMSCSNDVAHGTQVRRRASTHRILHVCFCGNQVKSLRDVNCWRRTAQFKIIEWRHWLLTDDDLIYANVGEYHFFRARKRPFVSHTTRFLHKSQSLEMLSQKIIVYLLCHHANRKKFKMAFRWNLLQETLVYVARECFFSSGIHFFCEKYSNAISILFIPDILLAWAFSMQFLRRSSDTHPAGKINCMKRILKQFVDKWKIPAIVPDDADGTDVLNSVNSVNLFIIKFIECLESRLIYKIPIFLS